MAAARLLLERGKWTVSAVARALGLSRPHLSAHRAPKEPCGASKPCAEDDSLLARIRAVVDRRGSYGYRRVTAMLNREVGAARVNHKRTYRVMRGVGLLLPRYTGHVMRVHNGKVITPVSDMRWCSDTFEIRCWSGERVYVAFALDCCDREVLAWVAKPIHLVGEDIRDLMAQSIEARFGAGTTRVPHALEWLSDNGPPYTAHETRSFGREAGLSVCTTPAYSPESNGMAEAFVKTFKRDYVYLAELPDAEAVLRALSAWFGDYNDHHPHRGLGMRSPRQFRAHALAA
jgi:transposase InsO family protein